jgi:lysophospholipase L1-like esterase
MPSKSGKTKKGYYSIFRYQDLVEAYGSDDFSDLDVIHISGGAVAVTVKSLKWFGKPLVNDLGSDSMIFQGSSNVTKANRMLTNFYTEHAGGSFDAAVFNKGSYVYLEYTGAVDGVYLACSSSSGGKRWAVVKASESGTSASGKYYSKFKDSDFSKAYGTDFARLDHIYVYSAVDASITLKRIAYFSGTGAPLDTSDGSWERAYEGIALFGDSIIENPLLYYGDWNSLLGRTDCDNWGIGGQTTKEIEARIDDMLKGSYDKIVILCGTNDIGHWMAMSETMANYQSMFEKISKALPAAKVYMVSILPPSPAGKKETQNTIVNMNTAIEKLIADYDFITYIDCYSRFVDKEGNSIGDYYSDTVHPNEKGFQVITEVLLPYLQDNED